MLCGCSANWHIKRAIAKDPSILEAKEIRFDTVIVTQPVQASDTFTLREYDTIVNTVNDIKYRIIRRVDTFQVDIECPPDTVVVSKVIECDPVVKYTPLKWYNKPQVYLIGLIITALVFLAYRAFQNFV